MAARLSQVPTWEDSQPVGVPRSGASRVRCLAPGRGTWARLPGIHVRPVARPFVALAFALAGIWWDNPTMAISTADAKRRIVLPAARPGDVFDIQSQGEGRLLLVRLEPPKPEPKMSMARCLEAIAAAPLQPKMTWDSLKAVTREP